MTCLAVWAIVACGAKNKIKHPFVQEYVSGQGNIQGNVNIENFVKKDSRFCIGADKNGRAVFKEPYDAFKALLENYYTGILLIQNEFGLSKISSENYHEYKALGWQVTTGSSEEQAEALFISQFLDIYENSFE